VNSTEERTATVLRSLAQRAAPATTASPGLAQLVLTRVASPRRRQAKAGLSALGLLIVAGVAAAASLTGNGDYREWTQPSGAMSPTVAVSQTVLVGKQLAPQRGDVVLLEAANGGETSESLSRVIGLPGDTVSCPAEPDGTCKAVIVSGRALDEPWLRSETAPFAGVLVPQGHAYLLGDARDAASDSRLIGPQSLNAVLGVVVARFDDDGQRQAVPGTPPHALPEADKPIDPADPVPPARTE